MTDDRSDVGRALAALRPRQTVTCEVCGRQWEGLIRPNQQARTCSNRCRQTLFRRAKREERPGERPS